MDLKKIENKLDQYNADDYFVEMSDLEDVCANEVGCWKQRLDAENEKANPNKHLINLYMGKIQTAQSIFEILNVLYSKKK